MRNYRVLISVPITAKDDTDATDQASAFAQLVSHPNGQQSAHVELMTEVATMSLLPVRTVFESIGFRGQIPMALL